MLTQKQINNLKPGDPIVINGTVNKINKDGHVLATCGGSSVWLDNPNKLSLPEENTILYFPESTLKYYTPDEKQQLFSFLHAYYVDKRQKSEMRVLLKKIGIDLTDTPSNPARLFKKGDWVRIVKHQGRKFNAAPPAFQLGKTYRVSEDENTEHCYVVLQSCDLHYAHPVAFVELCTPVEELEPYLMLENAPSNSIEVRDKRTNKVEATFYFGKDHAYTFEQAATRAEAERDRLNAEWRKEQNYD